MLYVLLSLNVFTQLPSYLHITYIQSVHIGVYIAHSQSWFCHLLLTSKILAPGTERRWLDCLKVPDTGIQTAGD
jgi:hypothetical protein